MKIVIAPDSFKGSNPSLTVAEKIGEGVLRVFPEAEISYIPIGDGGEGTVDAVVHEMNGSMRTVSVTGPLGETVEASYGLAENVAIIEMAAASGLPLVPEEKKNPLLTTTYGTGELIRDAVSQGCRKILIGIGGSATNDGGVGMAQALGVSFRDGSGNEIGYGGGSLKSIETIDLSQRLPELDQVEIEIMCDVSNPLCGESGASAVYGPQKGASPEMVKQLDQNLKHLAALVENHTGRDKSETPGSGAAGGLGFGLMVFAGGTLRSGIEAVLDAIDFDTHVQNADLVITGEGKMDGQSIFGKAPVGVAKVAKRFNVPVLAMVGDIGDGITAVYDNGIDSVMSNVNRAMPLKEAMSQSRELMIDASERAMRMIRIGMRMGSMGSR
ncbi:MAG: glycerate kinase [Spirochaetales bacterium]|nr:glycerate kinase [Spirochaetales bacterium]